MSERFGIYDVVRVVYKDTNSGEELQKRIVKYKGRNVYIEYWKWKRDCGNIECVYHRTDGPADIWFKDDGKTISHKGYMINGKEVTDPLQLAVIKSREVEENVE